jgi:hypothetical protein
MDHDTSDEIERKFSGLGSTLGRIFLSCVTGEHILMITDTRKNPKSGEPVYDNLFIPVVCGQCESVSFEEDSHQEKGRPVRLHHNLIRGWTVFSAVQKWCERNVEYVQTLTDPLAVIGKCGIYTTGIDSVGIKTDEGGQRSLEVLQRVNASFFPVWTG